MDGKRADISVKRDINARDWNKKAGRMNPRLKHAKLLNDYLDQTYNDLLDCHRQLQQDKLTITAQSIKQRFLGVDKPVSTLLELIGHHQQSELLKLALGTAKNYAATEKYLSRFVKERFRLSDVSLSVVDFTTTSKYWTYYI